jgi:repressor LexA
MVIYNEISSKITTIRRSLNQNLSEFARSLEIPRSTLVSYENGTTVPAELLSRIVDRYGVSEEWLLSGIEPMFKPNVLIDEKNEQNLLPIDINIITKKQESLPDNAKFYNGKQESLPESMSSPPLMENLRELIEKTMEPKLEKLEEIEEIKSRLQALESRLEKPGGEDFTAEAAPEYDGEEEEDYEDTPYMHSVAAGPPVWMDEDRSMYVRAPRRLLRKGERYYALSAQGTSMTGAGILDGDIVLIRWTDVPADGAIQVVRYGDKVTLKLVREAPGKGWELRYMDGSGKTIICDSGEYETLGEFAAVLPKGTVPRER